MPQKNNPIHSFEQAKELIAGKVRAYKPSKLIVRIEIKIKPVDQLGWLSSQDSDIKVFGANQEDSASIAGVGAAIVFKGKGAIDFGRVFNSLRAHLMPQYPYLQWYGGFCFDPAKTDKAWSPFGSWTFVIPRFELARDGDKMIFSCNLLGKIDKDMVLGELDRIKITIPKKALKPQVLRRKDYPSPKAWRQEVESVLHSIRGNKCQKVVLARKTDLSFKGVLNPWEMIKSLKRVTPKSYHFAFNFGKSTFLGASPERLYKRFGRSILSEALAGTKPRSSSPGILMRSVKDQHEHRIVVDHISLALSPLCQELRFSKTPHVLTLSNGHHLNTKFQGQLKDGVRDEDILQSLHPTPALGGMPKAFALNRIRRSEPFSRGWYAGPLGYVGLDWAEFVIGIRSGLVKGKRLSVFAGAGIVEGSKPLDEWQEVENKISNFIRIIK